MQVSVENTSNLERRMTVGVPAERVESEVEKRLKQTARHAKIPGFRPGKVPMSVIRQRYEGSARQEALGEVVQATFYEAVAGEKLNPAGLPDIEPKPFEKGQVFEYVATFEVFPEFEVAGFERIEVERLQAEVTDADVEQMLENLRKQGATYAPVERAAQKDDQLVIDFVGKIGGEVFEGGSAKDVKLVLGSGQMIPGFEDALLGVCAGEERVITPVFPADYHNAELAGKTAEFTVTVHSVSAPELPELDEAFFARFGVSEGGLDGFRAEIRKNMDRELQQVLKSKVKTQVMEGLASQNPVDVPKALVSGEIDRLRAQAARQFGGKIKPEMLPADLFEEQARKRVLLGLIIAELVRQKELKADDGRIREMITEMAAAYQDPEQVVSWYYQNPEQLNEIRSVVLEEQVVDTVLQQAKVTDRQVTYEEAVKPLETAPAA